jgi:hypothetical protein
LPNGQPLIQINFGLPQQDYYLFAGSVCGGQVNGYIRPSLIMNPFHKNHIAVLTAGVRTDAVLGSFQILI